jgi:hypothetical protein
MFRSDRVEYKAARLHRARLRRAESDEFAA